jgi:beta-lactamase class A
MTRLDRNEPALNTNLPNDPRDTTTPEAMIALMQSVLLAGMLMPASRDMLMGWLKSSRTGLSRLRAGLPADWSVGDKTGTGESGALNDVAIAWPPGRAPILIAAYFDGAQKPIDEINAAHAEIGRIVAQAFT